MIVGLCGIGQMKDDMKKSEQCRMGIPNEPQGCQVCDDQMPLVRRGREAVELALQKPGSPNPCSIEGRMVKTGKELKFMKHHSFETLVSALPKIDYNR